MRRDPFPNPLERQLADAFLLVVGCTQWDVSRWRRLRVGDGRGGVTIRLFPDRDDYALVEETDDAAIPAGSVVRARHAWLPLYRAHRRAVRPRWALVVAFRLAKPGQSFRRAA